MWLWLNSWTVSGEEMKIKGYKDRASGYTMQIFSKNVACDDLCISYLLLGNISQTYQNLMAWNNNKHVLSLIVSEGQEFWSSLGSLMRLQSDFDRACGRPRLDWGGRIHTLTWLLDQKVGAGKLVSLYLGLSMGLLECPHDLVSGFPQSNWIRRSSQMLQCLLWPKLGSHIPSVSLHFISHFPSGCSNYCTENKLERSKIWDKDANFGSFFSVLMISLYIWYVL